MLSSIGVDMLKLGLFVFGNAESGLRWRVDNISSRV